MSNGKTKLAMTDDEVASYLATQRVLNVATLGPSGHPHLVAMWYVMMDGRLRFWTPARSQKIANLRRDSRMTGLIESGDTFMELKGLELVGQGRLIEDFDTLFAIGKEVAERHNGPGAVSPAGLEKIEAQAHKRVAVEFEIEKIVSWDHTKIGRV